MEKIILQLKRLEKHYEHTVKTYDEISMLDMAHTLRIWTELKSTLTTDYDSFKETIFWTATPIRKIMKHIHNSQYVLAYLPKEGVTTYASKGQFAESTHFDNENKFSLAVKVKNTGQAILLSQYGFVSKALTQEYVNAIGNEKDTKCSYINWLGSETVRLQYKNETGELESFTLSREMLIKRVANVYDASHTSLNDEGGENRFDAPIKWLMGFKCGGLPLPCFLLLKVAQDILENVPILLSKSNK
ncbi:MAG: hypothetical protein Q8N01_04330 [Sulfuricurvum sp.]|nr:hypothetical protein [Sulfuricurvum sp.]MDP3022572.1 hypothetical protein [Sulfuricurvum sp.]MDP3119621.1 hypothetical protein [Sulfuricurvum sp.]